MNVDKNRILRYNIYGYRPLQAVSLEAERERRLGHEGRDAGRRGRTI